MAESKVTDIRGTRVINGLVPALYDRVTVTYPDSVTEVYTFYYLYGTVEQVIVGVVTLTYNGSGQLLSAERTS